MERSTIVELSELDQIMPRLYVRWLLCFPLSRNSPPKDELVKRLEDGVRSTLDALPILAGFIVAKPLDPSRVQVQIPEERVEFKLKVQHHDDSQEVHVVSNRTMHVLNAPKYLLV